jgi:hypothetical protein
VHSGIPVVRAGAGTAVAGGAAGAGDVAGAGAVVVSVVGGGGAMVVDGADGADEAAVGRVSPAGRPAVGWAVHAAVVAAARTMNNAPETRPATRERIMMASPKVSPSQTVGQP